ncbi:hypothetical protein BGZ94_009270 [Podila epigama]|nr:hypothetical protein BGZ94_009270 [Podila epigama]
MSEEEVAYNDGEYDDQEIEEEYYDEDENGEWNGEGEDSETVQVGDEIPLTHDEVWDDTALIEHWDAAMKQYEAYHSKAGNTNTLSSSKSTISAKELEPKAKATPSNSVSISKHVTASLSIGVQDAEEVDPEVPASELHQKKEKTKVTAASVNAEYTASDRKPSFKKADKPAFSHYKDQKLQQQYEQQSQQKQQPQRTQQTQQRQQKQQRQPEQPNNTKRVKLDEVPSKNSKQIAPAGTVNPPVDEATIAYYRQMGYYYDPSYASSELSAADSEQTNDPGQGSSSTASEKKDYPATAVPLQPLWAASHNVYPQLAHLPLHPLPDFGPGYGHGPGYLRGHPMPHMPGVPMPGGHEPGMPYPSPFRTGAIPSFPGHGPPHPMVPPVPPMPTGQASAGVDDEVLGNLIMAWYFSGYYTGLYQAQRR